MKSWMITILLMVPGLTFAACGGDHEPTTSAGTESQALETPATAATGSVHGHPDLVTVTAEGNRFDPAISPDRIPEGAWRCEMNPVHYASLEQGDGKCPICHMNLIQATGAHPGSEGTSPHDHAHDHTD